MVEISKKQGIDNNLYNNYATFFDYLTSDCLKNPLTYIDWTCTPDLKSCCNHITKSWQELKQSLQNNDDKISTVNMMHFKKMEITTKKGKTIERLKALSTNADLTFIIEFIDKRLVKFIHHRNQLKHYRSINKNVKEHFDAIYMDLDFSENLDVPVKFEPQSLHWCHQQVTVHSGILKVEGEKSCHPYFSNDRKHDQQFVNIVMKEMLQGVNINPCSLIIIETDNCSSQYKSSAHFHGVQDLANELNVKIIRIFGIAQHGKGEVDHVAGIAKTAIRRAIATGDFFRDAGEMVEFLNSKYKNNTNPNYAIKELYEQTLERARVESRQNVYDTINGSSFFQVMIFSPNSNTRVANRLCLCELCKINYGSCDLFKDYNLSRTVLKETSLRSSNEDVDVINKLGEEMDDYFLVNTICAVAADAKSIDAVWFIKINGQQVAEQKKIDDYGNVIASGQTFLEGNFLEKIDSNNKRYQFKLMKKKHFFF